MRELLGYGIGLLLQVATAADGIHFQVHQRQRTEGRVSCKQKLKLGDVVCLLQGALEAALSDECAKLWRA